MKVKGLDNREHKFSLTSTPRLNASLLHIRARELLRNLFPYDILNEEVFLPGTKTAHNKGLYADFYIHSQRLMIEVNGQQHFDYNPYFYDNKLEFAQSKQRDLKKREWCELNGIDLVELPYNESDNEWRKHISCRGRVSKNGEDAG